MWWLGGVLAVTSVVVLVCVYSPGPLTDLSVYRSGGSAWLHDIPLYTKEFPSYLPYTYPPVSAVVFSLLAVLPFLAAAILLTVAGLLGLSATTKLTGPLTAAAVIVCLAFEPVRTTLLYGQVNLVLMGLVALDCLLPRTRYPRGMLIGIAAAIKLTPLVFVLFFLARRQYRAAVITVATFVGVTGLGVLLAPADSGTYWRTTIFAAARIGEATYSANQSLRGALSRLDLGTSATNIAWLVLVAAVLVLTWLGARRAANPAVALLVVAAGGLLVSPVSWSHHWVWIVPAVALGAVHAYRRALPTAALAATVVVFAVGQQFLPHGRGRELDWSWWQHLVGDGYLLAALAFLVWSVARRDVPHVGGDRPPVSVGERG
jgi:alpha-1,2-mannosyltransferase